jgi:hypothetical protein
MSEETKPVTNPLEGLSVEAIQEGLINQQFFFHLHLNALTELLIEQGLFTAETLIKKIDEKGQEMEKLTETLAAQDEEVDSVTEEGGAPE